MTAVGAAVLISSIPSSECTTHARSAPRRSRAAAAPSAMSGRPTPRSWRVTNIGLVRGPRRLKMVGMGSAARMGATAAMAGWHERA